MTNIAADSECRHRISVNREGDLGFTCNAPEDSECRQYDCQPECARSSQASGECGALFFFDPCDPTSTYNGTTARSQWRSGPIEIEWGEEYGSYLWRFPGEDRDLPTDPQSGFQTDTDQRLRVWMETGQV